MQTKTGNGTINRNSFSPVDSREIFPVEEPEKEASSLLAVNQVRLVVLDDDPSVCHMVRSVLGGGDFHIDVLAEAGQVKSWLQGKQDQPYHLVILNFSLHGLEPDQVLTWVKDYQPDASVIVVTSYPSLESALVSLRAHAYDYLVKPLQLEELQGVITRCLWSKGLLRLSEEALRESLGMAIRERRKALGLTLAQMAHRTNLSLGYLSQIELGKNSASIETLYRISLGLGVKMGELFQSVRQQD